MHFIFELLFQIIFEFACYGIGRAFLLVLAPHYGVESLDGSPKRPWKWQGWSFVSNGRRYFYTESVQMVGLLVLIVLVILVAFANYQRS